MLTMTRYLIKNECLSQWVKFIWYFEAEEADIHYKLLPTDSIDIILNTSGNIIYENDSCCISAAPFHINGLRSKPSYIHQSGNIRIFGISCYPFGLYPFVNKSLASIQDQIPDLYDISTPLAKKLEFVLSNRATTENIIDKIVKILYLELQVTENYKIKAGLIQDFLEESSDTTIKSFCVEHGINPKTFMRNVLHYTGYTPKTLRSIKRFQKIGNQLIFQESYQLSGIAYDNGFADQAHFIREFRKFSGASPRTFQLERSTIKENTRYKYQ